MRTAAFLLFFFLWVASCKGQNNPQTARPVPGEPVRALDSAIWVIFQDHLGRYWFGSDGRGLYQYDGRAITRYRTRDGLPGDRIRDLQEDQTGNLIISTTQGFARYDGRSFRALPVTDTAGGHGWRLHPGDLWFGGRQDDNGPYRYDGNNLYHLPFPKHYLADAFYAAIPHPPYNPYQVYRVYKDRKGQVWFGTSTFGVCRYDGKNLSWLYERHLTHIGEEGSFGIRAIAEDRTGAFWFTNNRYRYHMDAADSAVGGYRYLRYQRTPGILPAQMPGGDTVAYFPCALRDDNGDLWFSTRTGVWRYDGRALRSYPVQDARKDLWVCTLYKDRQGSIWLGTTGQGAYKLNGEVFERFLP